MSKKGKPIIKANICMQNPNFIKASFFIVEINNQFKPKLNHLVSSVKSSDISLGILDVAIQALQYKVKIAKR